MKKKILGFIIFIASAVCMVGCGSSKIEKTEDRDYKVGDYLTYGSYEQDNNKSNGKEPIEWEIICVEDGKALIISKYGLDVKIYDTHKNGSTWETCSLRSWLNNEFLNDNFSDSEKKKIIKTIVTADDNEKFEISGGNDTEDKIFLLSIKEVEQYLTTESSRECIPTEYAKTVSDLFSDNNDDGKDDYECCAWWLRTVGDYNNYASCIWPEDAEGGHYHEIADVAVTDDYCALRPAMWIDISSLVEDSVVENDKTTETEKNDETVTNPNASAEEKYNAAILLMESGKYEEAMKIFDSIFTYKDSFEKSEECKNKADGNKYNEAIALMDAGKYEEAAEIFKALDPTKYINELSDCEKGVKYNVALKLVEAGKVEEAYSAFVEIQDFKDSKMQLDKLADDYKNQILKKLENLMIGESFTFGNYGEPIEWIIIDKTEEGCLVLSKKALSYISNIDAKRWENSNLRKWMNGSFYNSAFTDVEKELILTSKITEEFSYTVAIGNYVEDKVFAPSYEEYAAFVAYGGLSGISQAYLTVSASESYGYGERDDMIGCWCLRSNDDEIEYVDYDGENQSMSSMSGFYDGMFTRPAMWIGTETNSEIEDIQACQVGDIIKFGKTSRSLYWLDPPKPIKWKVLEIKDGKALVISEETLTYYTYDDSSWENSTIRKEINGSYYNGWFSDVEKSMICTTEIPAKETTDGKVSKKTVKDKIFLLSEAEVNKYFPNPADKLCISEYMRQDMYEEVYYSVNYWWTRTTDDKGNIRTVYMEEDGAEIVGRERSKYGYVRPAMWIDLT